MAREKLFTPGKAVGAFRVTRLLAIGGMATVYEARPHSLQREDLVTLGITRVALKVPRLDALCRDRAERQQMIERLEREYQTLLKLMQPGYPNLVEVYELGWHRGTPFLAMEYIDGPSLEDVLAGQPSLDAALRIFRMLCETVAYLHAHGVQHRDLKPANVLMRGEEPVLIDLGICRPPTGRPLTAPGELAASPLYVSPEAAAHCQNVSATGPYLSAPTDDVWALGLVLYEVLTGDLPWRTPSFQREALLWEIREGALRHPSDVNPRVPHALGDAAMRLLERSVARRPRDARAALAALEPGMRHLPASLRVPPRARPMPGPWEPAHQRFRNRRAHGRRAWMKRAAITAGLLFAFGLGFAGRLGFEVLGKADHETAPIAGGVAGQPLPSDRSQARCSRPARSSTSRQAEPVGRSFQGLVRKKIR